MWNVEYLDADGKGFSDVEPWCEEGIETEEELKDILKGMTLEDAIYILSQPVTKFHEAKSNAERINLPRPRTIRAYELVLEAIKS